MLAITGLQFHDLLHTFTQQDVELDKLYMDVAVYNARLLGAAHTADVVALACRTALAYRGVAHVTMPVDVRDQTIAQDVRTPRNVPHHVSEQVGWQHSLPSEERLGLAAEILNGAKKPAILAGQGALGAGKQLAEIAERLGAPVAKALLGMGALADDSPYATGGIGLLGTRPSQEALEECDALLIVGSSFPYIELYSEPGQVRIVQIDHDPKRIGLRAPVGCPLIGDAAAVL
jgi:pyruvate dehydrogenase (quinone)